MNATTTTTATTTTISLGELIVWALQEASKTYNINVPRYIDIINRMEESHYRVSTFNEFYSYYDPLLRKIKSQLSEVEFNQLVNNKNTLCGMILNIFNQVV